MSLRPRPQRLSLYVRASSSLIRLPLFVLATVLFGSASLLSSMFDKRGCLQHRIARIWARASMLVSGSRVSVENAEIFKAYPVAVYCSNHLSYMDTPAIFSSLPFQFRIVARSTLWSVPFIGWHLQRSGQIAVNVDNPRASISSLSGGIKTLNRGIPLFVFPEGGRSRDGHPAPFLNGPAYMAVRAKVPLVPMAIIGTHELLPMHSREFFPTPVKLAIGEPIDTSSYSLKDVELLTRTMKLAIHELYYQHSYLEEPRPSLDTEGERANGAFA